MSSTYFYVVRTEERPLIAQNNKWMKYVCYLQCLVRYPGELPYQLREPLPSMVKAVAEEAEEAPLGAGAALNGLEIGIQKWIFEKWIDLRVRYLVAVHSQRQVLQGFEAEKKNRRKNI